MFPTVVRQDFVVVARKLSRRRRLPERARARLQKVLMENALMVRAVPSEPVEFRKRRPAVVHARKRRLAGHVDDRALHVRRKPATQHRG
jgi:hypothetical protein